MAERASIAFGGRTWEVRPLTLGQIKTIVPQLLIAGHGVGEPGFFDACAEIVSAALGRDYPEMTAEQVMASETTAEEIGDAIAAITRISGLVASGEARAGSVSTP